EAVAATRAAVALRWAVYLPAPEDVAARAALIAGCHTLAQALARHGALQEAADAQMMRHGLLAPGPAALHDTARGLAALLARRPGQPDGPTPEREAVADLALATLIQAIDAGLNAFPASLRADPSFEALRQRPAWQAGLRRLEVRIGLDAVRQAARRGDVLNA